jgi:glycosyltransferase involved in cell wall biosynthesis
MKNIPIMYESHNDIIHGTSKLQNKIWEKELLNNTKKDGFKMFLCISNELSNRWEKKGVPSKKLKVLHDGFDEKLFMKQIDINSAKKSLKLPVNKKAVVYVGSLYKDRGIEHILKLSSCFRDTQFVIVGGPEKEKQELIKETSRRKIKNVMFKGRVKNTEVPMYLFAADALLMIMTKKVPTIDYCSPLKLFEYMASGRTIVGYGFKAILEVLKDDINSLLAMPEDQKELKQKLASALSSENTFNYGTVARKEVFEKYRWSIRAENLIKYMSESSYDDFENDVSCR